MKMLLPKDIEYCIEVMAGSESPPRTPKKHGRCIGMYIKLARYDVNFVNNVSSYIHRNEGMTSRQRDLAIKLTSKYRKQFRQVGVDITKIVLDPVFRTEVRTVDRSKRFDFNDKWIYLHFPYNQDWIKEVNGFLRDDNLLHDGNSKWNQSKKRWEIDNNEHNFLKMYNWCKEKEFDKFSDDVEPYVNELNEILNNKEKYSIYATHNNDSLVLHNAPEELQKYWDENIKEKSILQQIKSCGLLAINLDNDVLTKYNFNILEKKILTNRFVKLDNDLSTILFSCLDLGFEKIAVGLSSHSTENIKEIKKIARMWKARFGTVDELVISGKSNVFDGLGSKVDKPIETTKVLITDKMSRLHNKEWDFDSEITIGYGMFSKRNVFQSNKVIEVAPKVPSENEIDSDELF